jgi:hypothetical protein
MRRTITFISVLALMMSLLAIGPAIAENPDHCPGANEGNADPLPEGWTAVKVEATGGTQATINSFVPIAGTIICIKSGGQDDQATGIFTVDNSGKTLQQWLYHFGIVDGSGTQGRDVSYYMVYTPGTFTPAGELAVEKTVDTAVYDRTVNWEHTKDVNGKASESFSGVPGQTFNWTWNLTWTKNDSGATGHRVSGTITVSNGVNLPIDLATLTDQLQKMVDGNFVGAGTATVLCGTPPGVAFAPQSLAAGGTLNCTYSVTGADPLATQNRVDVAGTATVPAGYANSGAVLPYADFDVKTFTYSELLTGSDTAQLVDELLDIDEPVTTSGSRAVPDSYTCEAADSERYDDRYYRETIVNESSLTPTGGTAINRSATVTIDCRIPYQGLTPGFWKQSQHFDFWTAPYTPSTTVGTVFIVNSSSVSGSATLLEALDWSSGNTLLAAKQKLVRQAVAALLNAAHPDVDYPMTQAEIISAVNTALQSSSRDAVNTLANQLDTYNNLGNVDLK